MLITQTFYVNGLVQDSSISIANALEILQSCTKPLIYSDLFPINMPQYERTWLESAWCCASGHFWTGPRFNMFNIKKSSYQNRKFHCGDKTVIRSSYLHNGISYTGKIYHLYFESGPWSWCIMQRRYCSLVLSRLWLTTYGISTGLIYSGLLRHLVAITMTILKQLRFPIHSPL